MKLKNAMDYNKCILYNTSSPQEENDTFSSSIPNDLRAAFKAAKDTKKWVLQTSDGTDITLPEAKTTLIGTGSQIKIKLLLPEGSKPVKVQGCTQTELLSNWDSLTTLNVTAPDKKVVLEGDIIKLDCQDNALTGLNVEELLGLQELDCKKNQLTSLDVKALSQLQKLNCSENQLTNLEVSALSQLQTLNCSQNQLTSLDVQNLSQLQALHCDTNQLENLDLQNKPQLKILKCYTNKIDKAVLISILNALPERQASENAQCILFTDQSTEHNYTFTAPVPPDVRDAFKAAKEKNGQSKNMF